MKLPMAKCWSRGRYGPQKAQQRAILQSRRPLSLVKRTKEFGSPFAFCVDIGRIQWIRRSDIAFWGMRHIGGLLSIHRARTRQEEISCPMRERKFECTLSASDDGREHRKRGFRSLLRAGLGRRVDDIPEFSFGEQEAAYIAGVECYGGVRCQMRALLGESSGVTRQYGGLGPSGRVDGSQNKSSPPASIRKNLYRPL